MRSGSSEGQPCARMWRTAHVLRAMSRSLPWPALPALRCPILRCPTPPSRASVPTQAARASDSVKAALLWRLGDVTRKRNASPLLCSPVPLCSDVQGRGSLPVPAGLSPSYRASQVNYVIRLLSASPLACPPLNSVPFAFVSFPEPFPEPFRGRIPTFFRAAGQRNAMLEPGRGRALGGGGGKRCARRLRQEWRLHRRRLRPRYFGLLIGAEEAGQGSKGNERAGPGPNPCTRNTRPIRVELSELRCAAQRASSSHTRCGRRQSWAGWLTSRKRHARAQNDAHRVCCAVLYVCTYWCDFGSHNEARCAECAEGMSECITRWLRREGRQHSRMHACVTWPARLPVSQPATYSTPLLLFFGTL